MRKEDAVTMTGLAVVAAVAAVVVTMRERKRRNNVRVKKQCLRILADFATEGATPVHKLWNIAHHLSSSLIPPFSLSSSEQTTQEQAHSFLDTVVSYVAPLPTGEEKGWFYGVNLRGRSFLILTARLRGKNEPISHVNREEFHIPPSVLAATSQELFDNIALELAEFINRHGSYGHDIDKDGKKTMLGFTYTYPPDETEDSVPCSAIKWTNFSFDDTEAKELVDEINIALDKHGLNMQVYSLVDDTVGDLASGRYYNNDSIVAVNLGMGTSAAYVEQAHAANISAESGKLVVNVDWGAFTSPHLPLTEYDKCLDVESLNPGCRIFEKLVSGMYLGEIVRKMLLKMAQQTALFGHKVPPKLARPNLLRPQDLAAMHQDTSEKREVIDDRLRDIFSISSSTPLARELVAEVCDIVAERGARLVGAGIVGILKKLERMKEEERTVVIVQGGLYEEYRIFRNYLHSSVWEMLGSDLSDNVVVQSCHAGSGSGSLFLAASQSYNS